MKKLFAIIFGVFFALSAAAQSSDTTVATARAGILVPLTVSLTSSPRFGTFTAPSVTSTFHFVDGGAFVTVLDNGELPVWTTNGARGNVRVYGTQNSSVTTSLSSSGVLSAPGGHTMAWQPRFCSSVYSSILMTLSTVDGDRYYRAANLCGGLTVAADQAPGSYSGSYTVTASYN